MCWTFSCDTNTHTNKQFDSIILCYLPGFLGSSLPLLDEFSRHLVVGVGSFQEVESFEQQTAIAAIVALHESIRSMLIVLNGWTAPKASKENPQSLVAIIGLTRRMSLNQIVQHGVHLVLTLGRPYSCLAWSHDFEVWVLPLANAKMASSMAILEASTRPSIPTRER